MTNNNNNSSDNLDDYSKPVLFENVPVRTQFRQLGCIYGKVNKDWSITTGGGCSFYPSEIVFIKPATIEPVTKPLVNNNSPVISFDVSNSLPYNARKGIEGLFNLVKIQLENRFLAGDYTFDEIKNYAFQKIDAITSELGWVFGNWSIFVTFFPGNPSKQIPGRISIGFTDENQEDSPEMCNITVEFPIVL